MNKSVFNDFFQEFNIPAILSKYMQRHRGGTKSRYSCEVCKRAFAKWYDMHRHKKKEHEGYVRKILRFNLN